MRLFTCILAAAPLVAEIVTITPRRTRDYDERGNQGWCSIRVWVDDEVNIFVEEGQVVFETVRGQTARDAGSECSQPLPRGNNLTDFQFRGIDGRGEVRLIEEPGPRNRYRAWVRIRDAKRGGEEHHFKLNWRSNWTSYGSSGGRFPSGRNDGGGKPGGVSAVDRGNSGGSDNGRYYDDRERTWKFNGDGVCFYADRDFRGDALCAGSGENRANMGRVFSANYQSMRFFGRVREVEVFEDENYRGTSSRLSRDERDLGRWAGKVQSFRVR
ncbi:MAG: hypothetical protein FJW39_20995 [Acidobacteria bacterium]|nr:hypothetical protein [Acidobacteriota bacterium]